MTKFFLYLDKIIKRVTTSYVDQKYNITKKQLKQYGYIMKFISDLELDDNQKILDYIINNIDINALGTGKSREVSEKGRELTNNIIEYKKLPDGYKKQLLFENILQQNRRLIYREVKRYDWSNIDEEERFQEGCIGLLTAIDRFNPIYGTFTTYAVWWIRQAISIAVSNRNTEIRIPVNLGEKRTKLNKIHEKLLLELGREPTDEELAIETKLSIKKIQTIKKIPKIATSLNDIVPGEKNDTEIGTFISDRGKNIQTEIEEK